LVLSSSLLSLKKVETKEKDSIVVLYFNSMDEQKTTVTVNANSATNVKNLKPSTVVIYDYYETGNLNIPNLINSSIFFYNFFF
jgi:hypothetical protein